LFNIINIVLFFVVAIVVSKIDMRHICDIYVGPPLYKYDSRQVAHGPSSKLHRQNPIAQDRRVWRLAVVVFELIVRFIISQDVIKQRTLVIIKSPGRNQEMKKKGATRMGKR